MNNVDIPDIYMGLAQILLSSLETPGVIAFRLEDVPHEFMAVEGIAEYVTNLVLNVKGILLLLANYYVENTRVCQDTDYDRLVLDITTDKRLTPSEALSLAVQVFSNYLESFISIHNHVLCFDSTSSDSCNDDDILLDKLCLRIDEIGLSVRSTNCLSSANIDSIAELTTVPKAKELRRFADLMITLAKENTLASRRRAITYVIGPRFQARNGGYTRIIRLPKPRVGDNTQLYIIEYLPAQFSCITRSLKAYSLCSISSIQDICLQESAIFVAYTAGPKEGEEVSKAIFQGRAYTSPYIKRPESGGKKSHKPAEIKKFDGHFCSSKWVEMLKRGAVKDPVLQRFSSYKKVRIDEKAKEEQIQQNFSISTDDILLTEENGCAIARAAADFLQKNLQKNLEVLFAQFLPKESLMDIAAM
ncbi:hypothetical protein ACTFIR_003879 [Dictyostelium discoideum]